MAKKYRSDVARSVYRAMADLKTIGAIDKTTMHEFDRRCLTTIEPLSPEDIKTIRQTAGVSQSVFAEHLGVTAGLVSKWECGDKHPSRMALKLLSIVRTKGLDVIA